MPITACSAIPPGRAVLHAALHRLLAGLARAPLATLPEAPQ